MTLPPEARRSHIFQVRCSRAELLHVRDVAAAMGLTVAEWARRRLFGDRAGLPRPGVRHEPGPAGAPDIAHELGEAAARADRERRVAEVLAARGEGASRGK
jgi:hypothetical protein